MDPRGKSPSETMLRWIAEQVSADPSSLQGYAEWDHPRREHFIELLNEYAWRSFGLHEHRELSTWLMNQARSTDQGMALVVLLIAELRHRRIIVPVLPVLERLTIAARARARREACLHPFLPIAPLEPSKADVEILCVLPYWTLLNKSSPQTPRLHKAARAASTREAAITASIFFTAGAGSPFTRFKLSIFCRVLVISCTTQPRRKNYLGGSERGPFSMEIGLGRFMVQFVPAQLTG